jgi:hypothetical protein
MDPSMKIAVNFTSGQSMHFKRAWILLLTRRGTRTSSLPLLRATFETYMLIMLPTLPSPKKSLA